MLTLQLTLECQPLTRHSMSHDLVPTTIIAPGATLRIANAGTINLSGRALENGGIVLWTGAGNLNVDFGSFITNRAGALFEVQNNSTFNWPGINLPRFDNAGTFRKTTATAT